ncbi:MAG: DUF6111 family protein [Kiloniellales bacterium]|nr:DUF6111 family protein [Kiloniellales bacterium]
MVRMLITVLLPIVAPFLLYWIYLVFARRKAQTAGGEARPPGWQDAPWTWIALSSLVLVAATLITVNVLTGVPPGTKVEPPRLIDGEIRPARPVE